MPVQALEKRPNGDSLAFIRCADVNEALRKAENDLRAPGIEAKVRKVLAMQLAQLRTVVEIVEKGEPLLVGDQLASFRADLRRLHARARSIQECALKGSVQVRPRAWSPTRIREQMEELIQGPDGEGSVVDGARGGGGSAAGAGASALAGGVGAWANARTRRRAGTAACCGAASGAANAAGEGLASGGESREVSNAEPCAEGLEQGANAAKVDRQARNARARAPGSSADVPLPQASAPGGTDCASGAPALPGGEGSCAAARLETAMDAAASALESLRSDGPCPDPANASEHALRVRAADALETLFARLAQDARGGEGVADRIAAAHSAGARADGPSAQGKEESRRHDARGGPGNEGAATSTAEAASGVPEDPALRDALCELESLVDELRRSLGGHGGERAGGERALERALKVLEGARACAPGCEGAWKVRVLAPRDVKGRGRKGGVQVAPWHCVSVRSLHKMAGGC
jgi:hypothetical protein